MKELAVISGKGGTGKTSVVASLATLVGKAVLADCDVDAADLHLVLSPRVSERHDFFCGHLPVIDQDKCTGCGVCLSHCRFDAISQNTSPSPWAMASDASSACRECSFCVRSCSSRLNATIREMAEAPGALGEPILLIDPLACEGCGVCVWSCSAKAIDFRERLSGQWMVSETRCGPMVHAELGVAEANSGKLVSLVRTEAKKIAEDRKLDLVLIDGSPGIGCPVIASIGGADLVLVVTEPTLSGMHDLQRVADLTRHFGIETIVCINKWDLNESITSRIEAQVDRQGLKLAGEVRYDRAVTEAQIMGLSVVEYARNGVADDIRDLWGNVRAALDVQAADTKETTRR